MNREAFAEAIKSHLASIDSSADLRWVNAFEAGLGRVLVRIPNAKHVAELERFAESISPAGTTFDFVVPARKAHQR